MIEKFNRTTPIGAVDYFRHCIAVGDLQGTLSCFANNAVYIDQDGKEIKGLDNIEKAMQHLCTWKPKIKGSNHKATIVGNHAIWIDKWSMKATLPDGNPIEMDGATSCMMIKNENGIWLWLIDNPFAAAIFMS